MEQHGDEPVADDELRAHRELRDAAGRRRVRQVAGAPRAAAVVAVDDPDPAVARDGVVDPARSHRRRARRPARLGQADVHALERRRVAEVPRRLRQPRRQDVRPVRQPARRAVEPEAGDAERDPADVRVPPLQNGQRSPVFMSSW